MTTVGQETDKVGTYRKTQQRARNDRDKLWKKGRIHVVKRTKTYESVTKTKDMNKVSKHGREA